jgi:hypothetical protein
MKHYYFTAILLFLHTICLAQNTFPTNGNVGIGTNSPEQPLHIYISSSSKPGGIEVPSETGLKLSRSGTANYSYPESAEFRLGHGGQSVWGSKLDLDVNGSANQNNIPDQHAMTWQYNGNVGIGTINPQNKLHIYQNVPDQAGLVVQGNTINTDLSQHYVAITLDGDYGNGLGNYSQIRSYSNLYSNWGSQLVFYTTASNTVSTLRERMRIDGNGNVGIGTADPKGYKLAVAGNMIAESVKVQLQGS